MLVIKKIFELLDVSQRPRAIILLGLMFIGMLLETLGIGMIIPVLTMISEPNIVDKYPAITSLVPALDNAEQSQLITWCMLLLLGIYTIKNVFLAFLAWRQADFAFGVMATLSQNLFTGYIYQPYNFHLKRNSAELIRNVSSEIQYFSSSILHATNIITELLVLIGICILLVVVEPLGAIVVIMALAFVSFMFFHINKTRILLWGEKRQKHEKYRLQHLQQGLGGVKDVKILGREGEFLNQYSLHTRGSAQMNKRITVLQAMPRLMMEWLAILGLSALVFSILAQGKPVQALVPTLGLFAAAAFRLMPSVSRVLSNMQSLRYSIPVINNLHKELGLIKRASVISRPETLPTWSEINLSNIHYTYEGGSHPVLTNIELTIARGSSVGFIGESGAGKSTIIDVIIGMLRPAQGRILLDNIDIQDNLRAWQDQIGYVPQHVYLTDDTLRRNIAFGLVDEQIDDGAIQAALEDAQLESFVKSLPNGLETYVGERGIRLSGGQLQRIGIARALYHDPQVLVLDEATSALDTHTEQGIMQAVNALHGNKTILIVTHRLSTVAQCDKLYRLEHGRIVQDTEIKELVNT